jgi:hypothetical protein
MIRQLRRWLPLRKLIVVADSSDAVLEWLACAAGMIEPVTIVTRLRLDAALSDPAPVRQPGTTGRPRKKGARQPTLAQRLADPDTGWQSLTVAWYGGTTRAVEVASATTIWYHNGLPPVAIRWVLIRDPQGQFDPQALLCTDQQAGAQAILEWFVLRWPMEVTFHEVRAHLGERRRDNGPTWPSCALLLHCSLSFLWSPSLLISCSKVSRCPSVRRPGRAKLFRPSRIHLLSFVNSFGP